MEIAFSTLIDEECSDIWNVVCNHYNTGPVINEGRDGTVIRKGTHRMTAKPVVFKVVPLETSSKRDEIRREAEMLKKLLEFRSKNLIQCYGHFEGKYHSVLIFEFCERGDLLDKVNANGGFSEDEVRSMALQLVEGLVLLHSNGIAHRDVKLDNVFEDGQGQLKIGDFGFASTYSTGDAFHSACGTFTYAAPELLNTNGRVCCNPELVDVWALGVLFYALRTGALPFDGETDDEIIEKIRLGRYQKPQASSNEFCELLARMLHLQPEKRLNLRQLSEHTFFEPARRAAARTKRAVSVTSVPGLEVKRKRGSVISRIFKPIARLMK